MTYAFQKTYHGERITQHVNRVTVQIAGDPTAQPLHHIAYHSPTGLEWGYAGSGPADLALAILADHFGENPDAILQALRSMWAPPSKAAALHQAFKFAFVIDWPDRWEITTATINTWLGTDPRVVRILKRLEDFTRLEDNEADDEDDDDEGGLGMLVHGFGPPDVPELPFGAPSASIAYDRPGWDS